MSLQVEQNCPQCGGSVTISESDHLLTCPYCSTKIFLKTTGVYRYILPALKQGDYDSEQLLYVPYLHFKGNIFLVSDSGISYKAVDTTQLGAAVVGLPPSLGVRPQAMKLQRLNSQTGGRYLNLSLKARDIFEKAAVVSELTGRAGGSMYHRAFIGETVNFIYLPLILGEAGLLDGVTGAMVMSLSKYQQSDFQLNRYRSRWQVKFVPTLCPQCGWTLDGEGDCLVLCCSNCHTAWELTGKGMQPVNWQIVAGDSSTRMYLPFWKITANLPSLDIYSFADFVERTNQPMIARAEWREKVMSFWIPAFKLRPKNFLQAARQMTLAQLRLQPKKGFFGSNRFPVTLSGSEARQAVKMCLASSTSSKRNVLTRLPTVRPDNVDTTVVHIPFSDKHHDWYQPHSNTVIPKKTLRFGRSM